MEAKTCNNIHLRLEVLIREYLNKTSSKQLTEEVSRSQGTQAEELLSGDWTDSAMREATVKHKLKVICYDLWFSHENTNLK